MTSTARACRALNKAGRPCQAHALPGSEWCLHHDPALELDRRAARIAGGKARQGRRIGPVGPPAERVQLETVRDVVKLIEQEVNETLQLERSLNRARTIGYLAAVASKAIEISEIERRIEELERRNANVPPAP